MQETLQAAKLEFEKRDFEKGKMMEADAFSKILLKYVHNQEMALPVA